MKMDFLEKLFEILNISNSGKKKLRENLSELILLNTDTIFLKNLPSDKRDSFIKFLNSGKFNQNSFLIWIKENQIDKNQDLVNKITQTIKKTFDDFFAVLFNNADIKKKVEMYVYAEGQMI